MPTAELEPVPAALTAAEIDAQLAKLLESHHFCHSHRYPTLLRFLVEQTQVGKAALLKERLIGIGVFHRAPDYDTNTDPVVRVTAAEVRKRIAQYYQEPEHAGELRIDLPTGSYVPRFLRTPLIFVKPLAELTETPPEPRREPQPIPTSAASAAAALHPAAEAEAALPESAVDEKQTRTGRKLGPLPLVVTACVAVLLASLAVRLLWGGAPWRERTVRALWAPLVAEEAPVLVVLGDHTIGIPGNALRSNQGGAVNASEAVLQLMIEHEQVNLSDVISLSSLTNYMIGHGDRYHLAGAGSADIADLRSGPVLLFGGLNNRWTMRLTDHLRFRFVDSPDPNVGAIEDTQTPGRTWQVNFQVPYGEMTQDYALVARYNDPLIDEPVMIIAGIAATGTAAASEFVTSQRMVEDLRRLAPKGDLRTNAEVVLAMPVMDGHAGAPHIVASHFW